MKQIFDWLREQIGKMQEIDLFTTRYINRDKVHKIINEAESKWEAEVCEYEYHVAPSKDIYYLTSCKRRHNGMLWNDEPYCRYCGKRIKISEVE